MKKTDAEIARIKQQVDKKQREAARAACALGDDGLSHIESQGDLKKLRQEFEEIYRRQAAMYMHDAEPKKPIEDMSVEEWRSHVRERQKSMRAAVIHDLNVQAAEGI